MYTKSDIGNLLYFSEFDFDYKYRLYRPCFRRSHYENSSLKVRVRCYVPLGEQSYVSRSLLAKWFMQTVETAGIIK